MEIKLYKLLKKFRYKLNKQQYKTIKGQIKAGDFNGALRGMNRLC